MDINNHTFNPLKIHTLEMKLSIMLCKKYLKQGCGLLKSLFDVKKDACATFAHLSVYLG